MSSPLTFFGSVRDRIIATTNTPATGLPAKMSLMICGMPEKNSGTCVTPMPMAKEVAAMMVLRWSKPHSPSIVTPETMIAPNMMTVQPPSTQSGSVEKNAPTGGNRPARISVSAPNMIVNRLTTFVMATRPTFWLKDVMGGQPNTPPDTAEIKPSQAREPETSFSVMSRPRPPVQTAEVSPMVSAAETRNTSVTEMIAPRSNFGVKAKSLGSAMIPSSETVSFMDVKSTMPKNRDTI